MSNRQSASCGQVLGCVDDIHVQLTNSLNKGFEFIGCCFAHPHCKFDPKESGSTVPPIERPDLVLSTTQWGRLVVGMISPWIDVDSSDEATKLISEKTLHEELQFAVYLSLPAVLIPLKRANCVNLARIINSYILQNPVTQFWIQLPVCDGSTSAVLNGGESSDVAAAEEDTWELWNQLRTICNHSAKLGVVLEVTADLPEKERERRWRGEPIRALRVDASLFMTNKSGFPVLSKFHQMFICKFMFKLNTQVLISNDGKEWSDGMDTKMRQYMDHMWKNRKPDADSYTEFSRGYEDYLQVPLQPLSDNLESTTYDVFERDPVKYTEYKNAMEAAIKDKKAAGHNNVLLAVLGAGRGPLVTAALAAAKMADCSVKVYALEKNPHSAITCRHLKSTKWGESVDVFEDDMRTWVPPNKVDIVVSELLGSFSDNELSPECLDGALHRVAKDDAICIPESYTSYLAPVMSHKLFNETHAVVDKTSSKESVWENAYVVRVHNRYEMSRSQPVFTFTHMPPWDPNANQSRFKKLSFDIPESSMLHGFVGYFETILYGSVKLSTVPETHSPGMFSWFPILFPIKDPIRLERNSSLEVLFWRLTDKRQVWYEWCVTSPVATVIHNPNGRSYAMKL